MPRKRIANNAINSSTSRTDALAYHLRNNRVTLRLNEAVDYFVNTVFNYPTLAECYKTAAFDGINRLG
ncbi:MAG: hypothetical protein DYG89_13100 [Caldilinea sp. CFX5]|nr:hypothetical protein [Caldilinea sp. CFX5]